jgi:ABC-type bacteriocin/lantibiotic exporter with double-glycine peptidase domain
MPSVAGRAGLELAGLAAAALLAIGAEAALYFFRQRLVIELGTFLDRRISRRAFAHLLRLRIDGAGFSSGDAMNHFKQAEKIRDFALYEVPRALFDFGGALVALAMCFHYDWTVGLALPLSAPVLALVVSKQIAGFEALSDSYYTSIGVRQNALDLDYAFVTEIQSGLAIFAIAG